MVPATGVGAPADLGARFSSVLSKLDGRSVSADALFEALKLEALDWGFDRGIETKLIDAKEEPLMAEDVAHDKA